LRWSAAVFCGAAVRGGLCGFGDPALCPLFPVGSRRFLTACWIRNLIVRQ
jgi:hypothetical protein